MFLTCVERIARRILRLGILLIPAALLYVCFYIYAAAPDGGTMTAFRATVAELLCNIIAALGILVASAAIPDLHLF